jgi:hypothetical protein
MKVRYTSRALCFLYVNVNTKIYRDEMLPAVLYGCETWPVTLREEHKLKALMLFNSVHCDWIIHSQDQRTHS